MTGVQTCALPISPPACEPRTHSSPSPGLPRPRRAGCRRAGDASCRADGSRRPPPSARLRLGLQFQLGLSSWGSQRMALSPLPTPPSSLSNPNPSPLSLSVLFLVLRCSRLSFNPLSSHLSPPPASLSWHAPLSRTPRKRAPEPCCEWAGVESLPSPGNTLNNPRPTGTVASEIGRAHV